MIMLIISNNGTKKNFLGLFIPSYNWNSIAVIDNFLVRLFDIE
jgi:hypothetical protein